MSDIPPAAGRVAAVPIEGGEMKRLLLLAAVGGVAGFAGGAGCRDSSPPAPVPKADPVIHVKDSIDGRVGPVGAGRGREYQGPASQAPDWARPKPPAGR